MINALSVLGAACILLSSASWAVYAALAVAFEDVDPSQGVSMTIIFLYAAYHAFVGITDRTRA